MAGTDPSNDVNCSSNTPININRNGTAALPAIANSAGLGIYFDSGASINFSDGSTELMEIDDANGVTVSTPLACTAGITAATIDTGQGAYEVYNTGQDLTPSHSPTFAGLTITGSSAVLSSTQATMGLAVAGSTWTLSATALTDPNSNTVQTSGTTRIVQVEAPSAAWAPAVTNGCSVLTTVETGTNKVNWEGMSFSSSTTNYAWIQWTPPKSWIATSTFTFNVVWVSTNGTTGGVAWKVQAVALADDDAMDTAYGTAVEVDDAWTAANDRNVSPESGALTPGNTPAAGDDIFWRIYRDVDDAYDDLDGEAALVKVRISYQATGFDDD